MLTIRHVQVNDIFPVITLAFNTLPERYNPAIFNQIYESFSEGFFVALINQTVIGFLIGIKIKTNIVRILMLSIKKKYRKQGIGSMLISQFLSEMKNLSVNQVELEVRTTNRIALEFYKKHGFIKQEKLYRFYQNGENAYRMSKKL